MGCANVKGMPKKSTIRDRTTQHKENKCIAKNNGMRVCWKGKINLRTIYEVRSYLEVSQSQDNGLN